MATQRAGRAVLAPNLGLYLDRPPVLVPERAVQAPSKNFRIQNGKIVSDDLGWSEFPGNGATQINLDGKPVLLIEQFAHRGGVVRTIMGNTTDLFEYDASSMTVKYLTPRVEAGTVDVTNGSATVTGSGTTWNTVGANQLKAGDFIFIGSTGERDPSSAWYEIDSIVSDTEITLTTNYTGSTDTGLDYTARSTFRSSLDRPYFTEKFYAGASLTTGSDGDRWYCTNGIDEIVAWDGDSQTQVYRPFIGGTLDTCKYLKRYKNVMFFIAPTISGDERTYAVKTSAIGQPENVSTLEASEFTITDGTADLIAAEQIGELLAIYSEQGVTMAQFVGAPTYYVFRTAVVGYGPRSAHAIAKFPDHHLFLSEDAMYRFDGVAARPFNNHVWREVTRQLSPQRLAMIRTHFDESRGELHWVVPLNTDAGSENGPPENAYVTHYLEDVGPDNGQTHTFRELPATGLGDYFRVDTLTWDQLTNGWNEYNIHWNDQFLQATFPLTLFGDNNGDVWILNDASTKDGTPLEVKVRFSRRPAANNRQRGVVSRVYPMLDNLNGLTHSVTVTVRGYDTEQGTVQRTESGTFAVDESTRSTDFVAFRTPCLFYEVELETTGAQEPFNLAGYDVDAARGGARGRL